MPEEQDAAGVGAGTCDLGVRLPPGGGGICIAFAANSEQCALRCRHSS